MANSTDFIMRVEPAQFERLLAEVRACRICEAHLPNPPRPVLREWLRIEREDFYDERHIAIVPAGLCYPGTGESGDLPPRPECAPQWHPKLRAHLPAIRLTLLVGSYAQAYYLGSRRKKTLAETVRARDEYLPQFFPLPHPSPRNRLWMKKNPWFEREALPQLRRRFKAARMI